MENLYEVHDKVRVYRDLDRVQKFELQRHWSIRRSRDDTVILQSKKATLRVLCPGNSNRE